MRTATVTRGISNRSAKTDDLEKVINDEVFPLARQIRKALNERYTASFIVATNGDGAWTNIWTSPEVEQDRAWLVEAHVVALGSTETASYIRRATFRDTAGTLAQVGATSAEYSEESAAAIDVRFAVSGSTVLLDVRDDAVNAFDFAAHITVYEVSGE